jgi:hypothetical protein
MQNEILSTSELLENGSGTSIESTIDSERTVVEMDNTPKEGVNSEKLEAPSPRLLELEKIIDAHGKSWLLAGKALKEIQDGALFKPNHKSLVAYSKARFDFEKAHTYRLIEAAEIIEKLSPDGDKIPCPSRETQVRPLSTLKDKRLIKKAWAAAVEKSKGNPSSQDVEDAVNAILEKKGTPEEKASTKNRPAVNPAVKWVSKAMKEIQKSKPSIKLLRDLLGKIQKELAQD